MARINTLREFIIEDLKKTRPIESWQGFKYWEWSNVINKLLHSELVEYFDRFNSNDHN